MVLLFNVTYSMSTAGNGAARASSIREPQAMRLSLLKKAPANWGGVGGLNVMTLKLSGKGVTRRGMKYAKTLFK